MKKFTLTLLLIFGTVSALFAQQSVREDIFAFLKREGYVPTFDEDRDILFKVQGINYYAIIKEVAVYCTPKVGHFWGVFYEI